MSSVAKQKISIGRQFALNLDSALKVAGPQRDDTKPSAIRSSVVQRLTGIARSTLRALKSPSAEHDPNPDLRTMERLADMLGIPVAFLLMRPQDWKALRLALEGIETPFGAAGRLDVEAFESTGYIETILVKSGVHPDRPEWGGFVDKTETNRVNRRNEWRRRVSHVMAALTRQAMKEPESQVSLAAITASFVNVTTPKDPAEL